MRSFEADAGKWGRAILKVNETEFAAFSHRFLYEIDQAATQRSQATGQSVLQILGSLGIGASYQHSKREDRNALVNHLIGSVCENGEPAFLVHPRCVHSIVGFMGLYRRKKESIMIDDTEALHLMHAIQYPLWNHLNLRFRKPEKPKPKERVGVYSNIRKLIEHERKGPASYMEV
jgi:hypothetical protein